MKKPVMDKQGKTALELIDKMRYLVSMHQMGPDYVAELLRGEGAVSLVVLPNGLILAMRFENGEFKGCLDASAFRHMLNILQQSIGKTRTYSNVNGVDSITEGEDDQSQDAGPGNGTDDDDDEVLPENAFASVEQQSKLVN